MLLGSTEESPTIMSVKKIPIENTWAEFWKVVVIPEPAPRCSGAGCSSPQPGWAT